MKPLRADFPVDIQRLIFEIAARSDANCALNLVLVAKHVRAWVEPILYECIIVRTQHEASLLLETIRTKPHGFFHKHVKSLALGSSVTFQQAKPILAECSQRISSFAVWAANRNPSVFLPFISSPALRRLSLKSQHPSELNIPPAVLSALTHLVILDGPYTWYHLRNAIHQARASRRSSPPSSSPTTTAPDALDAPAMFHSLTHFGVCSQNWGSTQALLKLAKNLRYFAVIVPPHFKASPTIARRIAELGDRRVVLVEHDQTIENWETAARGGAGLWSRVERLVADGLITDAEWQEGTRRPVDPAKPRTPQIRSATSAYVCSL